MQESIERVRNNAAKCRDLADTAVTPAARAVLADLAEDYERKAASLERSNAHLHERPAFNWVLDTLDAAHS